MTNKHLILAISLLYIASSPAGAAENSTCRQVQTPDQKADAATIQRIETAWLTAEYRGDIEFLDCLLDPGYSVNAVKTNEVRSKADLLAQVAKNSGKTPAIPPLETKVIINGGFAAAFSSMHGHKKTGEPYEVAFADFYAFRDGAWHALAGFDL